MGIKKLKNIKMVEMLHQLRPLLSHKDMFGYVAARNTRILSDCLIEYNQAKNDLIDRFGTITVDEETGETTTTIKVGTPEFKSFCEAMETFNNVEHEVEIMTMKYGDTINCLTGEEILGIVRYSIVY